MATQKAKFSIGDIVKHKHFEFRGVIYDVDFEFNNSEEWYQSIPKNVRPRKDQPFYHLLAENDEITYEAFVKNYNTGTVWGPPLWIPYSSMLIGATLMTMSYISELILHVRKLKEFK